MPSSHSAYARTESAGVRWGSQPSLRSLLTSDRMCRVSPNRYSPVTLASSSDPYWRLTMSANFLGRDRRPAAYVEYLAHGPVVVRTRTLASITSLMFT